LPRLNGLLSEGIVNDLSDLKNLIKQSIRDRDLSAAAPEAATNLALMKRFERAFVTGDVPGVIACVTDDIEWHLPEGPNPPDGVVVRGRNDFEAFLADRIRSTSELSYTEFSYQVFGTTVIQRYLVQGHFPTRGPFSAYGLDVYTLRGGLIATKDAYWKSHSRKQPIGLVASIEDAGRQFNVRELVGFLVTTLHTPSVRALLGELSQESQRPTAARQEPREIKPTVISINEMVVTEQLLRKVGTRSARVKIPRAAIMTPAARDFVRDNGIVIDREG
jgi:ketosteroid isomerase-like protein